MQVKRPRRRFLYLLLLVVVVVLVLAFIPGKGPLEVSLSEFTERARQGQIDTIRQSGKTVEGLKDGKITIKSAFSGSTYELSTYLGEKGVMLGAEGIKIDVKPSSFDWGTVALTVILPIVLLGALFYFLFFRLSQISHSLLQLISQKQATKPEAKEREIKDIDSIEAIRKLAELRDQGILTQEEFEQKKKKLL